MIVSDNGTQLPQVNLRNFIKFYSIEHITTPSYHPRSKGQVERFVDSFKLGLKKINEEQDENFKFTAISQDLLWPLLQIHNRVYPQLNWCLVAE